MACKDLRVAKRQGIFRLTAERRRRSRVFSPMLRRGRERKRKRLARIAPQPTRQAGRVGGGGRDARVPRRVGEEATGCVTCSRSWPTVAMGPVFFRKSVPSVTIPRKV